MKSGGLLWYSSIRLGSAALVLAIWQIFSLFYPPSYLPGPWLVFQEMQKIFVSGEFAEHMFWTLARVLIGLGLSFVVAMVMGVLMGLSEFWEASMDGPVLVGLAIPGLAWAVVGLMLFGLSEKTQIFAIFMVVTPILAVNIWEGTKALDRKLVEMAFVFKADRWMVVRSVVLPQLIPYSLAAVRFGLALAWKTVVIAETFGASTGIGYKIIESRELLSMKGVLAWTLSFTLVMIALEFMLLKPIETRLTVWRPKRADLNFRQVAK
jgi:NitT/TauT family transport system permease protein